jgi:hypothetical protein
METKFERGQKVRSKVGTQGLVEGSEYLVESLEERFTAFGNFVSYVVREQFGERAAFTVTNGHLVLEAAEPTLSENQKKFVRAAKRAGLEVFQYSGRGMFGRKCPAVSLDRGERFATRATTRTDSLGMGTVVYAQD